jgi:hypothetical protein
MFEEQVIKIFKIMAQHESKKNESNAWKRKARQLEKQLQAMLQSLRVASIAAVIPSGRMLTVG